MTCPKTYFLDEKQAEYYIDKLQRTSAREIKPIRAYLCTRCFNWHLTSEENKGNNHIQYVGQNKFINYEYELKKCNQTIQQLRGINKKLKNEIQGIRKNNSTIIPHVPKEEREVIFRY
jgi:hypothetical protein